MAPRDRRPRSDRSQMIGGGSSGPDAGSSTAADPPGNGAAAEDHSDEREEPGRQRVDKWLWHARFFKTRSLAARVCRDGRVRRNGAVIAKPSALVEPQDVLTFIQGEEVRVVRIIALAERRGPASEARTLYEELTGD